jgi:hypothetical protein
MAILEVGFESFIALVFGVTGLLSYQIKLVNDKVKDEISNAKDIHKELCDKISDNKCKCEACC